MRLLTLKQLLAGLSMGKLGGSIEGMNVPHRIPQIIIQPIVTMPICGQKVIVICHVYITDILQYM